MVLHRFPFFLHIQIRFNTTLLPTFFFGHLKI
jgi:hypothetical protein